ncbi:MAG TPA: TetR/AcrR family transcriptional regulator [Mycobacterium sp.]|nr:TetR/AcrR family transcriptional regulator [Mycobacterium sp.]
MLRQRSLRLAPMADSGGSSSLSQKRRSAQANDRDKYNARRAEILRASGQVLHRHGVSKTTIGLIAKHAKVDRATMYYYFEDKYAIYRELILDGLTDYFDGIDTVTASTSPPELRLREAMSTVMQAFEKHYPQLYIFFQASGSAEVLGRELYEATVESGRRFEALLDRILHEGIDTGVFSIDTPVRIVIKQVVGMLNWTSRWFQPEGELDGVGVADAMADTILNGISSDRRHQKPIIPVTQADSIRPQYPARTR